MDERRDLEREREDPLRFIQEGAAEPMLRALALVSPEPRPEAATVSTSTEGTGSARKECDSTGDPKAQGTGPGLRAARHIKWQIQWELDIGFDIGPDEQNPTWGSVSITAVVDVLNDEPIGKIPAP